MTRTIGSIGNYFGALEVKEENGFYHWGIEDWNGTKWEAIPKSLYDELMKFQDTRKSPENSSLQQLN